MSEFNIIDRGYLTDSQHINDVDEVIRLFSVPDPLQAGAKGKKEFLECYPQQALGTLEALPPEIRSEIWRLLFPKLNMKSREQRLAEIQERRLNHGKLPDKANRLSCFRLNKRLYQEIRQNFYSRYQILTVTFPSDCNLITEPSGLINKRGQFGTKFDGIRKRRKLANVNFNRFSSIRLDVELPYICKGKEQKRLNVLTAEIQSFFPSLFRRGNYED
ncbi:MAG: hypothetical protein Q9213_000312 [Squamulea squamosa]